jgi:hypothetical protein
VLSETIRKISTTCARIEAAAGYFRKHPEVLRGYFSYARKLGLLNTLSRLIKSVRRGGGRRILTTSAATPQLLLQSDSEQAVVILAASECHYWARCISYALSKVGLEASITHEPPVYDYRGNSYFVIWPWKFALPPSYVLFQSRQLTNSNELTKDYLHVLENASAVLNCSAVNIGFLTLQGLSAHKMFYVPPGHLPNYGLGTDSAKDEDFDVIILGNATSQRQQRFLRELERHFKVRNIDGMQDKPLNDTLHARVVINIHQDPEALLETARIWECLSLHKLVVSERLSDMSQHTDLDQIVDFIDVDDVKGMVERVGFWLENDTLRRARIAKNRRLLENQPSRFEYFFYRFLLATDNITFDDFWRLAGHKAELPSDTVCLSLPEYVERAREFGKDNHYGFSCFPGLRHTRSWIGCAMSYKFLVMLARKRGLTKITICEDDVEFPPDFEARWQDIRTHLDDPNVDWDIFSALMANLDKDVQILNVHPCKNQWFATVDKLMSMVFNVYNQNVFDLIANWDSTNHDVTTNTIDRYLGNNRALRILTVIPFLVGHKESQQSTLWGVKNSHYTGLIRASNELLQNKIQAYQASILACRREVNLDESNPH